MTLKLNRPVLVGRDAPRVLTTEDLSVLLTGPRGAPSRNALFRWIHAKEAEGLLYRVARGLYLNNAARPPPQVKEAAGHVRRGAIVSLQKVLGDACITNNYTYVVTCIVPWKGRSFPNVGRVDTAGAYFWFHAMPYKVVMAGRPEDRLHSEEYWCAVATPERALLDWIYLSRARHRPMSGPPLDVELDLLDARRLDRLARAMNLIDALNDYRKRVRAYWAAPDVQANAAV